MPSTSHHLALVAAGASAAAGAIHAAASGSHAELATLSSLFALAAVAQIGWAMVALVRPEPAVMTAGVGIQVAAFGTWLATRTVGIGSIEGLQSGQAVGLQDGLAAALAGLAALSALAALTEVRLPRPVTAAVPAALALVALAVVPAMATPHDHDHDHGEVVGTVASGEVASGDVDHADGHAHDDSHDHGDDGHGDHHDDAVEPALTEEELGYPPSFVSFLDEAPDDAARERAEQLIRDTHEAMEAFPDEAAIQAAGFVSIGDGATGWEHYINVGRIVNPAVLDPSDIESIVLKVNPDGTKEVASAMYLMPFGTTMADVPDIAGDLTEWHDHQDLCWEGARVVGRTDANGQCARGEFRPTQPMLHVWLQDHPCGPFAGIEGSHGSGCGDHDH